MKLFVFGTNGRMSRAIQSLVQTYSDITLLTKPETGCSLIDFTSPAALESNLALALEQASPYMIGTTGLSLEQFDSLEQASKKIPILWASNTSLGANLLFELSRLASQKLPDFTPRIRETHHVHKKDSPSGTALTLQKALGNDCSIESLRIGETAGIHEISFSSRYETLSIKHEVTDRQVFAEGAILASLFLAKQQPALYRMKDVLGLQPNDRLETINRN